MRRSALIQLSLALVLSLAAGVLIFRWMNVRTAQAPQAAQVSDQVMVAVAAGNLPRGTRLSEDDVRLMPFFEQSVPQGAFNETELLAGRLLASDVGQGEPLTESRLLDIEAAAAGVSALIAPGKRAVAVKGNKVLGLSGFVRPGNRVDVLVTVDIADGHGRDQAFTKTVLENIKVLATGTELEVSGDDGQAAPVDVYTLEMDSEESERLAFAATKGTLNFALRNPAESTGLTTPGVDVEDLIASLQSRRRRGPGRAAPQARPETVVELITGTDRQTMRFQYAPAQ